MKEEIVSFEVAKLLKEAGFDEFCSYSWEDYLQDTDYKKRGQYFHEGDIIKGRNSHHVEYNNEYYTCYAAPSQSLTQKWLREEKKVLVEVRAIDDWNHWGFGVWAEDVMSPFFEVPTEYAEYSTYEEALEEGLKAALKSLLNESSQKV